MKYPIGYKFISRSNRKHKRVQTIVDYYTTTNLVGEIVRQSYVAAHEFMGQQVFQYDIPQATICLGEEVK